MKKSLLFTVLLLATPLTHAQERTASGSVDSQVTWTALSTLAKSASDKADMVNTRVDQVVTCGKLGKVYAPEASGADSQGCKSTSPAVPTCPAGQVLTANGSSLSCTTASATKPTFRNNIVFGTAMAFRWPHAYATCPANTVVMGGGGNCTSPVGWTFLTATEPSGNGWHVACDTEKKVNVTAAVWAVCGYLQ